MTLTGAQIVEMGSPVAGTGKAPLRQLVEADLPVAVSLRLARLLRDVDAEYRLLDQVRVRLIRKYGVEAEGGKTMTVPPGKLPEFMKEWSEAQKQEVVIKSAAVHITAQEMQGLRISPIAILILEPVVTFGDAEKKKLRKPKH